MKLSDLHPRAKLLIEAALPAFSPVLVADGVTDFSSAIDTAMQANGVVVVLGEIVWDHANPGDTATPVISTLYVNVYEQPGIAHAPAGYSLIDAVATALSQRRDFIPGRGMRLEDEKGGTVAVCEFHTLSVFNE